MNNKRPKKRIPGGLLFLLIVIALYGFAFITTPDSTLKALGFAKTLGYQLLPILALVLLLLFLSNLLIRPDWVIKHLGKDSGPKGWILAVVGGILSVGPIYAWYALLGDLKAKGMRSGLIATFLYNRGIKLPLLPLMVHYFGLQYTVILATYLTLFSLLSGVLLEWLTDDNSAVEPGGK